MRNFLYTRIVGIIQIGLTSGLNTCVNHSTGDVECVDGCCGDDGEEYCCGSFEWHWNIIFGIVTGGLILLSGLVSLIAFCIIYHKEKKKKQVQPNRGQDMQTSPYPLGPYPTGPNPTGPYPADSQPYSSDYQMAPPPKYSPTENNTNGQQNPSYPP